MDDPYRALVCAAQGTCGFHPGARDPGAERPLISAFFTPSSRLLTPRPRNLGVMMPRFLHRQSAAGATRPPLDGTPSPTVNDVHSQLNETAVARVVQAGGTGELQQVVQHAAATGQRISIAGGRHAMGGQQFGTGGLLLDMTRMNRVLDLDSQSGLVVVEAGIQWPELVNHLLWAGAGQAEPWGIIQKQTGADRFSIGGSDAGDNHGGGPGGAGGIRAIRTPRLVARPGRPLPGRRTTNTGLVSH